MNEITSTRRSLLRRSLALVFVSAAPGMAVATAAASSNFTARLGVRHVRYTGGKDRYVELVDDAGHRAGQLAGMVSPLRSPVVAGESPVTAELHTLVLDGGTLSAQGAMFGTTGVFHVVGGTGRFSRAQGSYELRLGGTRDELVLTIDTEEGR